MQFYIDKEYKCYVTNNIDYRLMEDAFFDNKCKEFVEVYRYIPEGESWVDEDGNEYQGCMVSPWTDPGEAIVTQHNHEIQLLNRLIEELKQTSSKEDTIQ